MKRLAAAALALGLAGPALAGPVTSYEVEAAFEDVVFGLESALTDRGLVIDWVSQVGEMLNRTGEDIGAEKQVFTRADVYQFCSALVSRKVMEADPLNIAHCPYGIFVAEMPGSPGKVTIGFRTMPEGEMQEVQELLDGIVREAAEIE